jgi:hypothetical protein
VLRVLWERVGDRRPAAAAGTRERALEPIYTTEAQHGHDAAPAPTDATAAATSPSVVRAEIVAPRGALDAPDAALEPALINDNYFCRLATTRFADFA